MPPPRVTPQLLLRSSSRPRAERGAWFPRAGLAWGGGLRPAELPPPGDESRAPGGERSRARKLCQKRLSAGVAGAGPAGGATSEAGAAGGTAFRREPLPVDGAKRLQPFSCRRAGCRPPRGRAARERVAARRGEGGCRPGGRAALRTRRRLRAQASARRWADVERGKAWRKQASGKDLWFPLSRERILTPS